LIQTLSESSIYKYGAEAAATSRGKSPDARAMVEGDMLASSSNASQMKKPEGSPPDEDVKDEIIDDHNVIAEVKLPENARRSSAMNLMITYKIT
jgi:hypothetical protein